MIIGLRFVCGVYFMKYVWKLHMCDCLMRMCARFNIILSTVKNDDISLMKLNERNDFICGFCCCFCYIVSLNATVNCRKLQETVQSSLRIYYASSIQFMWPNVEFDYSNIHWTAVYWCCQFLNGIENWWLLSTSSAWMILNFHLYTEQTIHTIESKYCIFSGNKCLVLSADKLNVPIWFPFLHDCKHVELVEF